MVNQTSNCHILVPVYTQCIPRSIVMSQLLNLVTSLHLIINESPSVNIMIYLVSDHVWTLCLVYMYIRLILEDSVTLSLKNSRPFRMHENTCSRVHKWSNSLCIITTHNLTGLRHQFQSFHFFTQWNIIM